MRWRLFSFHVDFGTDLMLGAAEAQRCSCNEARGRCCGDVVDEGELLLARGSVHSYVVQNMYMYICCVNCTRIYVYVDLYVAATSMYMSVYIHIYIYIYAYIYIYTRICIYTCIYADVRMYIQCKVHAHALRPSTAGFRCRRRGCHRRRGDSGTATGHTTEVFIRVPRIT